MDNISSIKDNPREGGNASEIEIKEVLRPYFRRFYWFIISAAICLILSYL